MVTEVTEKVCHIRQELFKKYGDQGKDIHDIYTEGGMTKEDALDYEYVLDVMTV